jgi:hypothetical protein
LIYTPFLNLQQILKRKKSFRSHIGFSRHFEFYALCNKTIKKSLIARDGCAPTIRIVLIFLRNLKLWILKITPNTVGTQVRAPQ